MPDGPKGFQEYLQSYNVSAGAQQRQTITVTDLISEGPIEGLVDGQASIYLNDDRAAPLSQATTPASLSKASISLTNNSVTATISDGTIVLADNGKKYLIVKKGQGSVDVTATDAGAASDNGVIHCTLTAGSSFFTAAMVSSPSNISSYVPCRLVTTDDNDGDSNEGYGEGSISKRTSGTVVTFIAGEGSGGTWKPSGTYNLEVDKVVEISSISGSTVTLASAWTGTTGSYKYDVTGTIVDTTDTVAQTQIANYEALTTQFRVGTKSQAPFVDTGGHGSTSISNSPSAGGTIEQTSGYGEGTQAAKELLGSSSAGFNLSAAQLQEVDEARVTWAYAGGHYAVSGKGNNQPTFTQYSITFQVKKPGETSFENTDILNREIVHSGEYVNAVTFVQKIDLDQYRPFIDFKLTIKRMSNHTGPGYKSKGETYHDWQGISAASITNTTCVIKDKLSHPYCAMAKVGFTSQQFQGMPKRGYHARGLKVKVPSNYVTREENAGVSAYTRNISTGVVTSTYQDWDGAFRRFPVYTNNPAWVFYDILTNNRYGLGDFLEEQDIDKYMLYRIARYCDELVDDGKGGTEPRFTCNLYFQKQADAYKVIKDIATVFRSMVYYFDGQVSPIMDAPSGPVYNFTKANVIDGAFSYEGTGSKTRINQCVVSWIDPDANYKVSPLLVEDRKNIADTGKIISQNSVAMGAITEGQALRYGRWKLWTAANQKEVVSFKSALNSSFILPGDIINVQDADRYSTRYGGRVSNSGTTRSTTSIPLDSSVTLLANSTYTLSVLFEQPGAFATENVTIGTVDYVKGDLIKQAYIDSNGNGTYTLQNINTEEKAVNAKATSDGTDALVLNWSDTHRIEAQTVTPALSGNTVSTITVESAFSQQPNAESIWVLTETTTGGSEVKGSAKEYKVLSIAQDANSEYSFTAVEHYDEKFIAVDEDFTTFIADTVYPAVRSTDVVPPVKDVRSYNRPGLRVSEGGNLKLSWTPPTNVGEVEGRYEHLTGYEIVHNFGTVESPIRILDPNRTSMSFQGLTVGTYKVAVRVINVLNNVSEPVIIKAQVSNKFKDRNIPRLPDEVPFCGTTSVGYTVSGNTFKTKKPVYNIKNPGDESSLVSNTNTTATAWQQDCSNLPNITWSESDRNSQGQFITEHAYILLDASDTTDRFKLLKYYKPTGAGTAHWYDTGTGNTTNRFGSALTGTFTKAAGSSKVTGSGTAFTTQIEEGDVLKLGSEEIRVSAVDNNTVLYLERASDTAHSSVSGFIPNIRIDYINDVIVARVYKTSSGLVLAETYSKVDAVIKAVTDIADSVTANQMDVSDLGDIATDMTGVTLTNPTITGGNISGFAPLASPAFTGTPTAPTASDGTNTTQLATTQFVGTAVSNLVDSAPSDLNTLNELAAALADDDAFSTTVNTALGNRLRVDTASQGLSSTQKTNALTNLAIQNINNTSDANKPVSTAQQTALNLKANLASPTFTGTVSGISKSMVGLSNVANESKATMFSSAALTGTPTAPTAGSGTNTTQIATTAFVQAAASSAAGGASGTTYTVSIPSSTTKLRLSGSDSTTDDIEFVGSGATTVTRTNDGKFTISSTDTNTNTNTQNQYAISCVDGDNSDEEKIRLSGSGHNGNTTDDVVLEAGTGLSIARSGDKITFTNTDGGSGAGTVTSVGTNTGLSGTITTSGNLSLALNDLSAETADIVGGSDHVIYLDGGSQKKKLFNQLKLSQFNNDAGFATTAGVSGSISSAVNDGTLRIFAGDGMGTNIASDDNLGSFTANQSSGTDIVINHADTSNQSSSNNSGRTYIQDITLDTFGHVTGIATATETVTDSGGTVTSVGITHGGNAFNTGSAITTSGNLAITMAGSSSQYVNGAGNLVTFPSIPSAANNATITISAGTDLTTGGDFTTDQSSAETITIDHANISRSNTTSTATPAYSGTFTAVDSITTNARGHVTAVNTKTVTIPASDTDSTNYFLNGISKSGNTLTFSVSGTTNQTYEFGANAFNSTTIPSAANNGTITINQAGVQKGQFTVDQSGNTTINLTDNNTVYTHPNHSGDVTSSGDGATTIANDAVTFAKMQNIATDTFMGRTASGSGDAKALSVSEARTMLNVENGATADQTASEILTLLKTVDSNTSGLNAATLDGQEGTYYLNYDNFSNTPTTITTSQANAITANSAKVGLATNNVTNASVSGSTLTLTRQGASSVTFTDNNDNTTYDLSVAQNTDNTNNNPRLLLAGTNSTNDHITMIGGGGITTTRDSDTQFTIAHSDTNSTTSPAGFSNVAALATSGKVKLLAGLSHDTYGHITGSNGLELDFTGTVVESSSGVVDIVASTITAENINSRFANFGSMAADVASITNLTTDFLDADQIISKDIRVGAPAEVTVANFVVGRTYKVVNTGSLSQAQWNTIGGTTNKIYGTGKIFTAANVSFPTDANAKANDFNNIALINGTNLTGQGAHLNSAGDFYLGNASTNKYVFWDQSEGTMTIRGSLNAGDITAGTINTDRLDVSGIFTAASAVIGSLNASTATIGTLDVSLLDSDVIMSRDIRVGPSQSGAAEIGNTVSASTVSVGDVISIVATGNTPWHSVGGTSVSNAADDHREYAVGDTVKVVSTSSVSGTTGTVKILTGEGTHLNDDGELLVGKTSTENFIYFSEAAGKLIMNVDDFNGVALSKGLNNAIAVGTAATPKNRSVLVGSAANASGYANVAVGHTAGSYINSGSTVITLNGAGGDNTVVGHQAGRDVTTGKQNVFIGATAGKTNVSSNLSTGWAAKTGYGNIGIGANNYRGHQVAAGKGVLADLTSGDRNISIGYRAGSDITTGSGNVIIGGYAGNATDENTITLATGAGSRRLYFDTSGNATFTSNVDIEGTSGITATKGTITDGTRLLELSVFSGYSQINSMGSSSGSSQELRFTQGLSGTQLAIRYNQIQAHESLLLDGATTTAASTANIISATSDDGNGTTQYHIVFTKSNASTSLGRITTNNFGTTYTTSSDYRLKENIQAVAGATNKVLSLNPVNFQWKDSTVTQDGFLAHEVAEVVPEAVVGEKDGAEMQSIDQSKLVPLLVKTIQELEARIRALEE